MTNIMDVMSLDCPVFRAYLFYNAILVLKMLAMSPLTGSQRYKNKAFANPEDSVGFKLKPKTHDDVERVRRAHLNDLENIPIYFVVSWIYLLTVPNAFIAINLFRAFTAARIIHTLVYAVVVIPQPARGLSFGVGFLITIYMAVIAAMHFF